jgi:hypothetical protein
LAISVGRYRSQSIESAAQNYEYEPCFVFNRGEQLPRHTGKNSERGSRPEKTTATDAKTILVRLDHRC